MRSRFCQGSGHSIGICWNARLMLMPCRRRYALTKTYQAVRITTAATVIQNSTGIFDGLISGPAAIGSFHSSQTTTAKNAAEIAPATGMIGTPSNRKFLAGEDSYSWRRRAGKITADIITAPQTTSSTSMKVRNVTALKAISHMKTTAPAVDTPMATTGVCTVSLTNPSLSGATRSNDQASMLSLV